MIDHTKVQPRMIAKFMRLARDAEQNLTPNTVPEQIVAALLTDTLDRLPPEFGSPIAAIKRLHEEGEEWYHSTLAVYGMGWRSDATYHVERL